MNALPPHLRKYMAPLQTFLPNASGPELELRCRVMSFRDSASCSLSRGTCSDAALGVVKEIERLGTICAFAPLTVAQLEIVILALRRLVAAVWCLDELTRTLPAGGLIDLF